MLVWRLNIWRNPTMGEKYTSPLSFSSGANSSLASDCGLLVIAPNRPQLVSFNALTVRSGRALPSLHQKFQPMSQGTYSASSFRRSNTSRAASMTSCPTPSPGIHAILYLAIRCRVYRCRKRVASWGSTRASPNPFFCYSQKWKAIPHAPWQNRKYKGESSSRRGRRDQHARSEPDWRCVRYPDEDLA